MNRNTIEREITSGEYTYRLTTCVLKTVDGDCARVYGISITGCDGSAELEDISTDFERVNELFLLLAEEQVFPVHLAEVAEDMLSE